MNGMERIEDGMRFIGRDDRVDLRASELPQTSELDQDWLRETREAMLAATSAKKIVELPYETREAQKVGFRGVNLADWRRAKAEEQTNSNQAAA